MKRIFHVLTVLALINISCTKELHEEGIIQEHSGILKEKLVGCSSEESVPGTILIRLNAEAVEKIAEGNFHEISGTILNKLEATSFAPAIPVKPKNEDAARRHGLDQWFIVGFDPQTRPEAAGEELAKSEEVKKAYLGG